MSEDPFQLLPGKRGVTHSLIKPKKKVYKRIVKPISNTKTSTIESPAKKKKSSKTSVKSKTKTSKIEPVIDFDIEFEEDSRNKEELDNELDNMMLKARNVMNGEEFPEPAALVRNQLYELDYGEDEEEDEEEEYEPVKKTPVKRKTTKKPSAKKTTGVKKGPGRPRKTPKKEPIPRKGIANEPTDPDDVVEVVYAMPLIFKKLIAFFKSLASAEIQIIFRPTEIIFYAQDHLEKSRIRVRVDAEKLHHYYCNRTIDIGVNCKDMELILNKVDKDYSSIIILSAEGSTQKNITMILENEMQIDEIHTVGLIGQYDRISDESNFTDEEYMIKFKYPSKYFKKTIADIKTI